MATYAPTVKKKSSFLLSSRPSTRMCVRQQRDVMSMSVAEICWPAPMRAIGAQNLLTMPGGVSEAGYLHKKGGSQLSLMKWPLRYVIIHRGCVYYFKSSSSTAPQGAFSLSGYNRVMRAAEETTSNNVFPFKIIHFSKKHRTWFFSAASEHERRKWMQQLRREIDHYNDRKECHIPSDSDSDADSFYGTIERQLDIKHPINTEDDYVEDEDDDDEEDYLKPDDDYLPTSTGRTAAPPPSYPPPPVPASVQHCPSSAPGSHKGPPPPVPNRPLISTIPKKPLPSIPPPPIPAQKDKPPPLPPPNVHRHLTSPTPPVPPPPVLRKPHQNDCNQHRSSPICEQLAARMSVSVSSHHDDKSAIGELKRPGPRLQNSYLSVMQVPYGRSAQPPQPPSSPLSPKLKMGLPRLPETPKPPPPTFKPPSLTTKPQQTRTSDQSNINRRASPDGQSFRSLVDEMTTEGKKRGEPERWGGEDDSDDDYENMLLPDSVFIDSTETCFVEKLFGESPVPPQDGLYAIRNSGTKTSKVLVVWDSSIRKARNYRLFKEDDCLFLECDVTFPSLSALMEHYHDHPLPHHGSLRLQKPFTKSV